MWKTTLIIILILKSQLLLAEVKNVITGDLYTPIGSIRDLAFELHSKEIQNLVSEKIVTTNVTDLRVKYFWNNNNFDVDIINSKSINKTTKEILLKEYKSVANIIIGDNFSKFVESYEYEGQKNRAHLWTDPTGLKDISEIRILKEDLKIIIFQKKSTGTTKSIFNYKEFKWSAPKKVLVSVEKNIYEGVQNIKVDSEIKYFKKNGHWLPKSMVVKTKHVLNQKKDGDYTRSIEVKYDFLNYHINTAEALRWFSTR